MSTDLQAAVQRGAAWLDEHQPDWWRKIDTQLLDLNNPCRCVLGQLRGDYAVYLHTAWKQARPDYEADLALLEWSDMNGFSASGPAADADLAMLTSYWLEEIAWRRSAPSP